jgi:dTDP-4-dehydrorhamnose reductase
MRPLELWGGVECTHNRVGDRYFDQLTRSGHLDRLSDLDRFHQLGFRTLRYPVLWERVAPYGVDRANWAWADERLHRLRELGIRPIVGLVHHGSGPRWTSLLERSFVNGLAEFAAAVAERYPWLDAYTPVNEPLTTARFSALYGLWYPHQRNDRAFVRALLHQVLAVRAAMKAVRRVNPAAQLVQTEDIGLIRSTSRLHYQAEFENARRWLSFDLLTARVDESHPMWAYLQAAHADEAALELLRADPCPPNVLGLNYYLTSDRYLDHRVGRHPDHAVGGNGRHSYVDLEAVRVRRAGLVGHARHLLDVWARYRLPVAITEVHAGCSREEQVRWLHEAWRGAHAAREAGAEVLGVTVWALLGSYDWNTLVTRDAGHYEPGVFDARSPEPRPTLLASLVSQLAQQQKVDLPVLQTPGWWRRAARYGGPRYPVLRVSGARARVRGSRRRARTPGRACRVRR